MGLTWLCIAYALWMMLFRPGSTILLFSRREDEAQDLLERLRQMHLRLPRWLQANVTVDNVTEIVFGKLGSRAQCFPTTKHSARSYTATMAIIDEADYIHWLKQLMNAVKPTIDAGGRLILLSTADKDRPDSEFKRIWHEAAEGLTSYYPIFLPWNASPERSPEWYDRISSEYEPDDLHQEYPESPAQALAPRQASKRFHSTWLNQCFIAVPPIQELHPWTIYCRPTTTSSFVIAADPAEGNPSSDPSAAIVLQADTWEEAAHLHGRFEPDIFAGYLVQAAQFYNNAVICVERNNHGHAVHLAIKNLEAGHLIYQNPMDQKDGWLSNSKSKVLAVDHAAQVLRDAGVTIHTQALIQELAMFEARTLKAPEGFHDDRAMALVIGLAALRWPSLRHRFTGESIVIEPADVINEEETRGW